MLICITGTFKFYDVVIQSIIRRTLSDSRLGQSKLFIPVMIRRNSI